VMADVSSDATAAVAANKAASTNDAAVDDLATESAPEASQARTSHSAASDCRA